MAIQDRSHKFSRCLPFFVAVAGIVCAGVFAAGAAPPDQPVGDAVGVIEGEAISVTGPMSIEVVHGQVKTVVRSGSDIAVKSGQARIELVEGGQISICGPAHLSVLKSGGSLTLALETGVIHVHVEREPALTIYTAQIQAQPVAIGDEPRDLLIGFETPGAMCIRTKRGAVRLEQQLTGQSVIVPQGGDVLLSNGQIDSLRNGTGHCACELQIVKSTPAPPPPPETSTAPTAYEDRGTASGPQPNASSAVADKSAPRDEPVYQVYMPPLRFDANAKVQPEPDPRLLVVIRRVRVRPTLVFRGRVEGDPVATAAATPPPAPPATAAPAKAAPASDSVLDRVRNFVRKLWSRSS
jgi:hypothetical protein